MTVWEVVLGKTGGKLCKLYLCPSPVWGLDWYYEKNSCSRQWFWCFLGSLKRSWLCSTKTCLLLLPCCKNSLYKEKENFKQCLYSLIGMPSRVKSHQQFKGFNLLNNYIHFAYIPNILNISLQSTKSGTFWMLRSMLSGRLKRNLKRCRTLSALRVESALSLRPRTSWKRVSAVWLAPADTNTDRFKQDDCDLKWF